MGLQGPYETVGSPVVGIAAQLPHRPDAPRHRARPRRVLVERVVLALVGHVRARRELLVGVDQPDGVPARAGNGAPAQQARIARSDRRGNGRPAHVEAERSRSTCRRPSTSPRARAHRASRAGRSSRGARSGPRRPGSSGRLADQMIALSLKLRLRRELELVRARAPDRAPAERGRPRERVDDGLVGAQRECRAALSGLRATRACADPQTTSATSSTTTTTDASHRSRDFGTPERLGVTRSSDSVEGHGALECRAGCEHERVGAGRAGELHRGGHPSSAEPHGSASAGQPAALNGNVKLRERLAERRARPGRFEERRHVSVGASRRSTSAAASRRRSR